MSVTVLGNGRAFDFDQTNTSFLLRRGTECWLIGCGVTVPRALHQLGYDPNGSTMHAGPELWDLFARSRADPTLL